MQKKTLVICVALLGCIRGEGAVSEQENIACSCIPGPPLLDDHWPMKARIGNASLDPEMTTAEVEAVLEARLQEKVSVLEIDVGLSQYLKDAEFQRVVAFLRCAACLARKKGLRAVVYYPSLESITENGLDVPSTMYKDHPDWVQQGMDGKPNVFYGTEEFWVESRDESAWLSPNGPYRQVYLQRVKALAETGLDGIWVDVPLFMDTGATWPGVEPASQQAFMAWARARGLNSIEPPTRPDWSDPKFRAWIRWRHENLADFLKAVHDEALSVNPEIWVIVENFPMDYLDATDKGLDGAFVPDAERLFRVWEVDSVSNTLGMKWATPEDFTSKIAMFKWGREADFGRPSWAFSYGNEPRDAGLVMAAALAVGLAPFEVKTPEMFNTVGSEFRRLWFGFVEEHQDLFPETEREARVAIWYSSASRDYLDYPLGRGHYGLYVNTAAPIEDPDWWATEEEDSCIFKPHLGGWRGAAHNLTQLRIPFRPVLSPGRPLDRLKGIDFLWLPNVKAMAREDVEAVTRFVEQGGVLLATGEYPGGLDELGEPLGLDRFEKVFGTSAKDKGIVRRLGKGLAIYWPFDLARESFDAFSDPDQAAHALSEVERVVRIHVEDAVIIEEPRWLHVEISRPRPDRMVLYLVHFGGLKQPIVQEVQDVRIILKAPEGKRVLAVQAFSTDEAAKVGPLDIKEVAQGYYEFTAKVDVFSVFDVSIGPEEVVGPEPYEGPRFKDSLREEAAFSGLRFVLEKMRDHTLPQPWRYGVWTNLLDVDAPTDVYAYGHKVTSETMGLMLEVSACLKDAQAYNEALTYVRDLMVSPLYAVVNWAMDPKLGRPVLQQDEPSAPWRNGNAPIDDLRVVRALIKGASQVQSEESLAIAKKILRGLYWTSVTDRDRDQYRDFADYEGGLIAYAWNWEEVSDESLVPPALATGLGETDVDIIPLSYQDLEALAMATRLDPRWREVLAAATRFVLDSEVKVDGQPTGLFWNGLVRETREFIGDFEYPETSRGKNLKVIQVLWTALHLAMLASIRPEAVDGDTLQAAEAAAQRSLHFFKAFYAAEGRVPEYLTPSGRDVPACVEGQPEGCLIPELENLWYGEARIYALLARLALALGDHEFASELIERHILADRVDDPMDPSYGQIGVSTSGAGDAEAWNVLESVLTLCLEAQ